MRGSARVALGSLAGAAIAAAIAPATKRFFDPPAVGVGFVTVHAYPKAWDYAVVALLVLGAFAGGLLCSAGRPRPASVGAPPGPTAEGGRRYTWVGAVVVFVLMWFIHDHPYAHMDPFHEGEHLTAGWLMKSGERPYGDFYIFHGLAVDAGLDALVLGDPPSPLRPRRLQTFLDAATLALLVPIAAELCVSGIGIVIAVYASLCAIAAFWLPVYPYFRMAPVLICALVLLRYARSGSVRMLFTAMATATLGLLWSLDTGIYAVAGTTGALVVMRLFRLEAKPQPLLRVLVLAVIAIALPVVVLGAVRADIGRFITDSFVIMPKAIDATWALPAPSKITAESLRYFLPLPFYGFLGAMAFAAWRRGERDLAAKLVIVTLFALLMFRTASGRYGWSHTRFALPFLGIAVVAFVLEPMWRRRWWVAALVAIPLAFHFEIVPNTLAGAKLLAQWPQRQRHDGLVPYPLAPGRGIYTSEANAIDLASLNAFIESLGPRDAPIFDFSNERALYYLLQRKPPVRCMEISMWSVPEMLAEGMAQLEANPPLCVIVSGFKELEYDGVPNHVRVPELARWIDMHYPRRTQIGRFVVAHR
ncbi:MAG TPA: hypothetical protein VHK90_13230 [Thermoanaerobaculia bacterium]|nr:hypothetical protein [Thermoanaerobaculia bacterium]